ncbi:MAG: WbqC family protein [Bacteroidales bacterium]
MHSPQCLMPIAYLGSIAYYSLLKNNEPIQFEIMEHFPKQTIRNRCTILTANGIMNLTVPIKKTAHKILTKDVKLCYTEPWNRKHLHAIKSAYGSSPYFEHLFPLLEPFYQKEYSFLIDFNIGLQQQICSLLKLEFIYSLTNEYIFPNNDKKDYRYNEIKINTALNTIPYHQVFTNKYKFVPNLSIIDLVFNEGLYAKNYLKTISI